MEKINIYFENGQLKVRIPEEHSTGRHFFLHDTYHIFKDWTEEKNVLMVPVESQWKYLIAIAKHRGYRDVVEITQDVEDYYQYQVQREKEAEQKKKIDEERKRIIESAGHRQKNGCGSCMNLEYVNAHWEEVNGERVWVGGRHYCKYALEACRYRAFDTEYEFEYYKANKYYNPPPGYNPPPFVAEPFPCAGCEFLEKANKAWEEINKEKEGNV